MSHAGGRIRNVSAAVLVGGASRRMGRPKDHVELGGVALATGIARTLEGLFEDVLLVGGDPPADAPGRRVPDTEGPRSALRGLVSALEAATTERLLVVATDLPFVTPALLLALVAAPEADAVVPVDAEGIQPLCALYRVDPTLERARANLAAEKLALRALLDRLETLTLEPDVVASLDSEGAALSNLNTPDDLARAERRAPRAKAP